MIRRTKRAATIGIAVGALAVAGGAAFAASTQFGSKDDQNALVADAAQRLGVTPQKLTDALQQAFDARVDAAVAAGELTKAQGDALKQRAASGGGLPGFGGRSGEGPGFEHHGFGHHDGPGPIGNVLGAAATYLGLTDAQLRLKLEAGQSLADVAKAQSKDEAGLKDAIVTAAKKDLAQAVTDGRLTQAQADQIAAELQTRVGDLIQRAGHAEGAHAGEAPDDDSDDQAPAPSGTGQGSTQPGAAFAPPPAAA